MPDEYDEYEYCSECRNCYLEEPAFNTWDCEYGLSPEWNEDQECFECEKFKEAVYEDFE